MAESTGALTCESLKRMQHDLTELDRIERRLELREMAEGPQKPDDPDA